MVKKCSEAESQSGQCNWGFADLHTNSLIPLKTVPRTGDELWEHGKAIKSGARGVTLGARQRNSGYDVSCQPMMSPMLAPVECTQDSQRWLSSRSSQGSSSDVNTHTHWHADN